MSSREGATRHPHLDLESVEPERLSKRLSRLLPAGDTELWLSPISIWEMLLLAERRRVDLPAGTSAIEWVETALTRTPMLEAPLNREVALRSRTIRVEHDD